MMNIFDMQVTWHVLSSSLTSPSQFDPDMVVFFFISLNRGHVKVVSSPLVALLH